MLDIGRLPGRMKFDGEGGTPAMQPEELRYFDVYHVRLQSQSC